MGPLYRIACAISDAQLPLQLVIIAGRNRGQRRKLDATPWKIPVIVNGFVTDMPDWMRASDVIITKAGPGTIMEALACGLPVLLSGFLPGQEEGNVTFVEQNQVGVLSKSPKGIAPYARRVDYTRQRYTRPFCRPRPGIGSTKRGTRDCRHSR